MPDDHFLCIFNYFNGTKPFKMDGSKSQFSSFVIDYISFETRQKSNFFFSNLHILFNTHNLTFRIGSFYFLFTLNYISRHLKRNILNSLEENTMDLMCSACSMNV